MTMMLNTRALWAVESMLAHAEERRVEAHPIEKGGRCIDCGVIARGSLLAGLDLARICLADLAQVSLLSGEVGGIACPIVQVFTDHPVVACLASQYAGWAITDDHYFAMGSGPMRVAYGGEAIYAKLGLARQVADTVVGVLESNKLPTPGVLAKIASACGVSPSAVTLLVAPTASLAGGIQVVARSVETALHKLVELDFDVSRVVSGHGTAPLPPIAKNDVAAIGRTNDAILYGARVILHVTGDDATIEAIGPKVPSSSSHDYGEPFSTIFARYGHDFYKVDPHLFSPAQVVFQNINTGRTHVYGKLAPDVLARSFYS